MSPHDDDRQLLAEAFSAAAEAGAITDDELQAYLSGALPEERQEALRERLARCPEGADRLLEMAPFFAAQAPEEGQVRPPAGGWEDLQVRISALETTPEAILDGPGPPARSWHTAPRWLTAVAAGLLVATLGLSLQLWNLRQAESRPVVNTAPVEVVLGTRSDDVLTTAAGQHRRVVFEVHLPSTTPAGCEDFRARLRPLGGGSPRLLEGLERLEGKLHFRDRLHPGAWTLEVEGCGEPLGAQRLDVLTEG